MIEKVILKDPSNGRWNTYRSDITEMAVCNLRKNGQADTLMEFDYCREILCKFFWYDNMKNWPNTTIAASLKFSKPYKNSFSKEIPIKQNTKKKCDKLFERSINLLNIIEDYHDWPRTNMYECDHYYGCGNLDENNAVYLFNGSSRWSISPHMLSLFTLIIRIPISVVPFAKNIKIYEDLINKIKNSKYNDRDFRYLYESFLYWPILFVKFNELFKNFPAERNWNIDKIKKENEHEWETDDEWEYEGISTLCNFLSGDHKLQSKFKELVDKYGTK